MAVQEQTGFDESTATGLTGVFPYAFKILRLEDMRVEIDGVVVDGLGDYTYTVSGIGEDAGGNVTITPNPTAGAIVLRALDAKLDRQTNYQYAGDLKSPTVNADFDRLWLAMQMIKRRALMLPITETGDNVLAASPANRAGKALIFDDEGKPIASPTNFEDAGENAAIAVEAKNAAVQAAIDAEESASRVDLGALDQAVEDSQAAAVVATEQAGISTTQAGLSAAARVGSEAARDAALLSRGLFQTTAQGIGQGVSGVVSAVPGSGGANGTFALGFSGGTQVIAPQGYFVVVGGAVTQITITYPGHYSAGTPTLSFAASSGLTGASATAVMAPNTPVGGYFSTPAAPNFAQLYRVDAGPVATPIGDPYPSAAAVNQHAEALDRINEAVKATNFNADQFATLITTISNPLTRYNQVINVDGSVSITQLTTNLLLIGPTLPDNALANKLVQVEASFTGVGSATGLAISINPSSASTIDTTNHVSLTWRATGSLVAYRSDGTTVASGVTFDPSTGSSPPPTWTSGDALKMTLAFRDDATTGVLSLFKNGVRVAVYTVTGLLVGYIGAMQRNNTNNTSTATLDISRTYVNDQPRSFYINGSASPGGNGTEAYPFQTLADAISRVSEVAGELSLYLKPGVLRGSIQIDGTKRRRVRVIGQPGSETIVRASTLRTSGWVKTGGYTNIWERDHVYEGVTQSVSGNGGVIDTTNASTFLPYTIYTRNSPNSSLATLDGQPGRYLVNTTDKKLYVHALSSVDPNTLSMEIADQQCGIGVMRGAAGANYWCNVELQNIRAEFAYSHNIAIQRAHVVAENCMGRGSAVSNGFGLDDSIGRLYGCVGEGNYNDGVNALGGASVPADSHAMWFFDFVGRYNVVGDGLSNHDGIWHIDGGRFHNNGKDGLIPTGKAYLRNVEVYDNAQSGIQIYPAAANAVDSYLRADNCNVSGNLRGFHANVGGAGLKAVMDIHGGRVANNGTGLFVFNDSGNPADVVMNAYNVRDGGGNTTLKQNGGGMLNVFADSLIP